MTQPDAERVREFPYDWLKSVMVNDLTEWPKKNPNYAFIGPHAAQVAIDAYERVVKDCEFWKNESEKAGQLIVDQAGSLEQFTHAKEDEIEALKAEVERLRELAMRDGQTAWKDSFANLQIHHERAKKERDQLRQENELLRQYKDAIYDYVQCTGNTSPKTLGYHVAEALVMDHKELRSSLKQAIKALELKKWHDDDCLDQKEKFEAHESCECGASVVKQTLAGLKSRHKELG